MKQLRLAIAALLMMLPLAASAALIFTDTSYTANSLTFTIDGDMTGYELPRAESQFSLQYFGDIWSGPTNQGSYSANTWSTSPFDNRSLLVSGNTGVFSSSQIAPYTWSILRGGSLATAEATNRTVTVTLGGNYLNTAAVNPLVNFVWGNGCPGADCIGIETIVGQTNFAAQVPEPGTLGLLGLSLAAQVPEPGTLGLLVLGLAAIGLTRRRKQA